VNRATSQPGSIWRLSIRTPDGNVTSREFLPPRTIVVGREPTCDIALRSPHVSRRHAHIEFREGDVWLSDASSSGTLVGSQLLSHGTVELEIDVPVQIGPFQLRVSQAQPAVQQSYVRSAPPPEVAPEPAPDRRYTPSKLHPRTERRSLAAPPAATSAQAAPASEEENLGTAHVAVATRRAIHRELLDNLDLVKLERSRMNDHLLRAKVKVALDQITHQFADSLPAGTDVQQLIDELTDEALGLGPLERLLADETITEIMVVDPHTIYVEQSGRIRLTDLHFTDEESARAVLERIVMPLGRRIDESSPMLDARLKDGSRVNAIIQPLSLRGTCITIRKFAERPFTVRDLITNGTMSERMARFLQRAVRVRKNILVSGGTGSGKTTLLNVLSASIPDAERIVTIEDSAELQLGQPHVVSLESRPPNMEGRGEVTIRDLVRNAMRMRPDRIIVGEVRGAEALDMLQAMNTGHDGSMTTIHANSSREALKRAEVLALMAGVDLPTRAIREQMSLAMNISVHETRFADGSRRITSVSEVVGIDDYGEIEVREIFGFRRLGTDPDGTVRGEFYATGYLPSFLDAFITHGLIERGDPYL